MKFHDEDGSIKIFFVINHIQKYLIQILGTLDQM